MDFPFEARCTEQQEVSPLDEGKTVRVVGNPSSDPFLRQQLYGIPPELIEARPEKLESLNNT